MHKTPTQIFLRNAYQNDEKILYNTTLSSYAVFVVIDGIFFIIIFYIIIILLSL